ncbi:hypothetical protein GQ457_07G030810 [Hibiscus cannabinus]
MTHRNCMKRDLNSTAERGRKEREETDEEYEAEDDNNRAFKSRNMNSNVLDLESPDQELKERAFAFWATIYGLLGCRRFASTMTTIHYVVLTFNP